MKSKVRIGQMIGTDLAFLLWVISDSNLCILIYICWFVNDMRKNKSKNMTVFEEKLEEYCRAV